MIKLCEAKAVFDDLFKFLRSEISPVQSDASDVPIDSKHTTEGNMVIRKIGEVLLSPSVFISVQSIGLFAHVCFQRRDTV